MTLHTHYMTNILTGLVALALILGSAAAQQESQKILAPGEAPEAVQQTIKAVLNTLEEHRGIARSLKSQ